MRGRWRKYGCICLGNNMWLFHACVSCCSSSWFIASYHWAKQPYMTYLHRSKGQPTPWLFNNQKSIFRLTHSYTCNSFYDALIWCLQQRHVLVCGVGLWTVIHRSWKFSFCGGAWAHERTQGQRQGRHLISVDQITDFFLCEQLCNDFAWV